MKQSITNINKLRVMKFILILTLILSLSFSFNLKAEDLKPQNKVITQDKVIQSKHLSNKVRETKSFGISLTYIGLIFNYVIHPNLDIELHLGLFNGLALKAYTNLDLYNFNFYLGAEYLYLLPLPQTSEYWLVYAPVGVQYLNKNGFQATVDIGPSYYSNAKSESSGAPAKKGISVMVGAKIGYHF